MRLANQTAASVFCIFFVVIVEILVTLGYLLFTSYMYVSLLLGSILTSENAFIISLIQKTIEFGFGTIAIVYLILDSCKGQRIIHPI